MSTHHALRIPEYLDHILQAIGRIKDYTYDMTETAFLVVCVVNNGTNKTDGFCCRVRRNDES